MLNRVEVRTVLGAVIADLPILVPTPESQYVIKDITGLEPVKGEIVTSPYATQDGGSFQSARSGERNIVFTIGFRENRNANDTIEYLRREMYSILPPKGAVLLRFYNTDSRFQTVEIAAWVESNLPKLFTKEPEVQVSLISPKPNFYELSKLIRTGTTMIPLEMPYRGDAEVGFKLDVIVNDDITKVIVNNSRVDEDLLIEWDSGSHPWLGDVISISTIPGDKYVRWIRGSTITNLMSRVKNGSLSMILGPNVNTFNVSVVTVPGGPGPNDMMMPFTMECTPAYIGL